MCLHVVSGFPTLYLQLLRCDLSVCESVLKVTMRVVANGSPCVKINKAEPVEITVFFFTKLKFRETFSLVMNL